MLRIIKGTVEYAAWSILFIIMYLIGFVATTAAKTSF